eukprot:scaffold225152_cov27-Tisochrysis_lutea.AAC.1
MTCLSAALRTMHLRMFLHWHSYPKRATGRWDECPLPCYHLSAAPPNVRLRLQPPIPYSPPTHTTMECTELHAACSPPMCTQRTVFACARPNTVEVQPDED